MLISKDCGYWYSVEQRRFAFPSHLVGHLYRYRYSVGYSVGWLNFVMDEVCKELRPHHLDRHHPCQYYLHV